MMKGARLAEWIIFHRLYVTPYNAFIDMCPAGFKSVLLDLGIVSCDRRVRRKAMVAFEAGDDIKRTGQLTDNDAYIICAYKHKAIEFIVKVATVYKDYPTRPIQPYEAWLLSDWLGIDVGYYLTVNCEENAL